MQQLSVNGLEPKKNYTDGRLIGLINFRFLKLTLTITICHRLKPEDLFHSAVDEKENLLGHFIIRYPREDVDSTVRFGFVILNPDLRGMGYGKEMLRLGIEYVKDNLSAKRIDLGVFANNDNARFCYESIGFREYSRRKCEMPIGVWECIDMELFMA